MSKKENTAVSKEVFTQEQIKAFNAAEKRIKNQITKVENGYLPIVPDIARIADQNLFQLSEQKNITEYAKNVLGMGKSTLYGLIAIANRFCSGADAGYQIKDEYTGTTFRNLAALLQLDPEKEPQLPENWKELTSPQLKAVIKKLNGIEDKGAKDSENEENSGTESGAGEEKARTIIYDTSSYDTPVELAKDIYTMLTTAGINPLEYSKVEITFK